jgi:hippurate hydrolase
MTALCRKAAAAVVGGEHVRELEVANMGGEDFGYYMEKIPGCYVRFGSTVAGQEAHPAHSSKFDFHEEVLGIGAAYYHSLVGVVSEYLLARHAP